MVWKAKSKSGVAVVIKVPSEHRFQLTDAIRRRLDREVRILLELRHPNLISLVDVVSLGQERVPVLEWVSGGSLRDRLDSNKSLTLPKVARVLDELLSALSVIHAAGVVHRDISPKNILFNRHGAAQLADLGAALIVDDSTITGDADRLGSLLYISKHQFQDPHLATTADDIYSLGQVAYEMLSRAVPLGPGDPPRSFLSDLVREMRSETHCPSASTALARLRSLVLSKAGARARWLDEFERAEFAQAATLQAIEELSAQARAIVEAVSSAGTSTFFHPHLLRDALGYFEDRSRSDEPFGRDPAHEDDRVEALTRCGDDPQSFVFALSSSGRLTEALSSALATASDTDVERAIWALSPERLQLAPCGGCGSRMSALVIDNYKYLPSFTGLARCAGGCSPDDRCPYCGAVIRLQPLRRPFGYWSAWRCSCPTRGSIRDPRQDEARPLVDWEELFLAGGEWPTGWWA